ncbi:retrovirus-related Pol polyprotein from transposon gypsy [Trichonephila inaurata madagascariensis]|uniref:RNA-directed DNA polymerase n=1 Tax=Trichonephila inaurata madagascariensis TaxID=2747483 RepID=A0A8X6YBL7_9ARAC|nr:retrovirus-related Pol polyprotein from transposon gypsy [Trichonephila inaurata madagascariensis]
MCIDYRKVNQKLVKDKFPLPLIEDVSDTLQEAKVYSTLDLRIGYFHVDVDEDCRKYTSFIIPDGQLKFNKVTFGLSTSPGVFQCYVSSIFRDLTRKGIVISYLDDLVIPAKDEKEGHVVENGTIEPSTAKTQAVRKFPEPTTIKQVQSFLGLTGYFRKYIKDYSTIAKPLSNLTRKENPSVFGTLQKAAFENLQNIMSEGPLLHIYKYGRTELHTDVCKQGYGAILLQEAEDVKLHPFYYMSKKTNTAAEKYDSYELEVLAIINTLKKFRVYLLGQHFKIATDCSAFQKTMHKKDLITRIARWAIQLEEFDYEIEHRAGRRMKHVDALSRYPKKFSNPVRIITDRGSAFTSKLFNDYCTEENIQHLQIATGIPRENGQVERIHQTLIPVLTKLSLDDSTKWYKYFDRLQRILNSTICRSTKWTPFELLIGTKMRNKEDIRIRDLLLEEIVEELQEQREFLRNDAKKNIETLQSENRKTYNKRR